MLWTAHANGRTENDGRETAPPIKTWANIFPLANYLLCLENEKRNSTTLYDVTALSKWVLSQYSKLILHILEGF
jgi:hypothetical protein